MQILDIESDRIAIIIANVAYTPEGCLTVCTLLIFMTGVTWSKKKNQKKKIFQAVPSR